VIGTASVLFGALIALAGGHALGVGEKKLEPGQIAVAAPHQGSCAGGANSPVHVELVPDTVVKSGGRERVEYHADLEVIAKGAAVAWRAEVWNDRDQLVVSNMSRGSGKGKRGDVLRSGTIAADLPDGYYELRFTAAIAGEDVSSSFATASQFAHVTRGTWHEINEAEWRRDSSITWSHDEVTP